jgi:hypothetical protein
MTRPDPRASAMTEDRGPDSLEANLRRLLKQYGLWGYHPLNSVGSEKGWVDWVILGPAGAIFAELKSQYGKPSSEQIQVGYMLRRAGLRYVLWRPSDYYAGTIEQALRDLAGVQAELFGDASLVAS